MTTAKTLLAPPLGTLGLWTVEEEEEEFMAGILPDAMPPPFSLSLLGHPRPPPHLPLSSPPPPPPPPFAPASDSGQKSGERKGEVFGHTLGGRAGRANSQGGHPYTHTHYAGFGFSIFLLRGEGKGRFKRLTSKKGGGREERKRVVGCTACRYVGEGGR